MLSRRFLQTAGRIKHLTKAFSVQSAASAGVITRQVYPYSNIKVSSNYHLKIQPYDLLDCPDGNVLRISLQPTVANVSPKIANLIQSFYATVQIDNQNVIIDTEKGLGKQLNSLEMNNSLVCLVEVPVKANLKIIGERNVNVENMYSDEIVVSSCGGDITTKNIQSVNVALAAQDGNIQCDGNTLAHQIDLRTHGNKSIHLRKVQGDLLNAISENGTISTDSCYAENSRFITQKGALNLKNVHKTSEIYSLDGGNLDVTGFHGVLRAKTNGGHLNFQLTEIYGESSIDAIKPVSFSVNISEFVEQHTCIAIAVNQLALDPTLEHLKDKITGDGGFDSGNHDLNEETLTIRSDGKLNLGKLSWMDSIKLKFPAKKDN